MEFRVVSRTQTPQPITQILGYCASIIALCAITIHAFFAVTGALFTTSSMMARASTPVLPPVAPVTFSRVAEESFLDAIKSESFWRNQRSKNSSSASNKRTETSSKGKFRSPNMLGNRPGEEAMQSGPFGSWPFEWPEGRDGTEKEPTTAPKVAGYRTVCVRLCDGFYWPISFATSKSRFSADARQCTDSCGSPSRLYVYKNPGEDIEDMRDLSGASYSKLRTAFLYRTSYDANCKCRAQPWEEASLDRHKLYALQAKRRKGDRSVGKALHDLSLKVQQRRRETRLRVKALRQSALKGWTPISVAALPPMPARRTALAEAIQASSLPLHGPAAIVAQSTVKVSTGIEPVSVTTEFKLAGEQVGAVGHSGRQKTRTGTTAGRMSLGMSRTAARRPEPRRRTAALRPSGSSDWKRRVFDRD